MYYKYASYGYSVLVFLLLLKMSNLGKLQIGVIEVLFLLIMPVAVILVLAKYFSISELEMCGSWKVWLNRLTYTGILALSTYMLANFGVYSESQISVLVVAVIPGIQNLILFYYMALLSHLFIFLGD